MAAGRSYVGAPCRILVALLLFVAVGGPALTPGDARAAAMVNTITVTSAADSCTANPAPPGTLRRAIADAAPGDTIQFALPGAAPWTITLDGCQLAITKSLTIDGPGPAQLVVGGNREAAKRNRVFQIEAPGVTLRGMTIAGGRVATADSSGAGIRVRFPATGAASVGAAIVLENLIVANNSVSSASYGPGISILQNAVQMTNVVVRDNSIDDTTTGTLTGGGGLFIGDDRGPTTVTMTGCTVQDNATPQADQRGGGIYLRDNTDTSGRPVLSLANSSVTGNDAANGGGIFNANSDLALTATTVSGNRAGNDGGGLLVLGGTATASLQQGTVLLVNSAGSAGGGMKVQGDGGGTASATLDGVTVSGNTAVSDAGGGINTDDDSGAVTLIVKASTISDNRSGEVGGGLALSGGSSIANTTISGNRAASHGGGVYFGSTAPVSGAALRFATVTRNIADSDGNGTGRGGGVYDATDATPGSPNLNFASSIVIGNQLLAPADDDCGGNVDSGGTNVIGAGTGCPVDSDDRAAANAFVVLNPNLADNGGPTKTHALVANSPALDNGQPARCNANPVNGADQRGIARPQGAGCDIGAYEARLFTLTTGTAGTGTVFPATGPRIEGSLVGVLASPTGGSTFTGWVIDGFPVGGPNPITVTMDADHRVVATFAAPPPSPSPSPSPGASPPPTVTLTLTTAGAGSGIATPAGATTFAQGSVATLTATAGVGSVFTGWVLDGELVSWKPSVTLTMNTSRSVVALFAPLPVFGDVPTGANYADPVGQLAARGIIRGCDQSATPPLFCPADPTLRHQMAALIVRAIPGWQDETGLPTFSDNTADTELMTRVATLQRHGVVRGYQDEVCAARGLRPPCYGPLDTVKHGQVLLFIARAMVERGYWTLQPDDRSIFPDQNGAPGADPDTDQQTRDHRMVVTYVHYVGNPPDVADARAPFLRSGVAAGGWGDDSSRAWFSRAFWPALDGYFGQDNLP